MNGGGRSKLGPGTTTAGALLSWACAASAAALLGCASPAPQAETPTPAQTPAVRFAVLADPHVYDASLSEPGPAYDAWLARGTELAVESAGILQAALSAIAAEKPAFLIICGDLTRDGEAASHRLTARILSEASSAGTPVFVVPGNHDILNPGARRFAGDRSEKVESVTPEQFEQIYSSFGYSRAFLRDPASLSYVAEPVPGLWLLALDSSRYRENGSRAVSGGKLGRETRRWMAKVLADARSRGATVVAFLHHGIMEHTRGEASWISSSVIDDFDAVGGELAAGGVTVVFSGHGHSQDVTRRTYPRWGRSDVIYDVETGSTSVFPNAWRLVDLHGNGDMKIESRFITAIPGRAEGFPEYSRERLHHGLVDMVSAQLARAMVGAASARRLAPQAADAAMEHITGDERMVRRSFDTQGLGPWALLVAALMSRPLHDLQTDLPPADNNLVVNLR